MVNKQQQKSWPASSNAVRATRAIKCVYFVRHLLLLESNRGLHRNYPLYRRSGNGCSTLPVTPTAEFQETSGRAGKSQTFLMHQKGRRVIPSLPLQRFSLKWSSSILGKACANVYGSASLIEISSTTCDIHLLKELCFAIRANSSNITSTHFRTP